MSFNNFNLSPHILKALQEKGYVTPTPIQQESIPHIMSGKDVIGNAQTGTGKTAAFCIPILQVLQQRTDRKGIRALILTPTRELAAQVCDNLNFYGKYLNLKSTLIYGGVSQHQQVQQIRKGVDILVATPGRLLDLMDQGIVNLRSLEILVLDEADRMLDMGFVNDIRKIIKASPDKRQNIFYSATMPDSIKKLVESIMHKPITLNVGATAESKADINQFVYYVEKPSKRALLKHIIAEKEMSNVLVFARTKHGADRIAKDLNRSGISAEAIHGDKSQNARIRALNNFKLKSTRVLVATDIAARGIDIHNLPYVINYELPESSETYSHRIGRTGRAGATGSAFSLCDTAERNYLKNINRTSAQKLMTVEHPFN